MDFNLNKLVNNVSKVTLKGGIFAKTCTVIIVTSIILLLISYISKDVWIMRFSVLAIVVIVFVMLTKLINFANKNPQAAILEGAEFLMHEQIQLAAKGNPNISQDLAKFMEERPIELTKKEIEKSKLPDIPVNKLDS